MITKDFWSLLCNAITKDKSVQIDLISNCCLIWPINLGKFPVTSSTPLIFRDRFPNFHILCSYFIKITDNCTMPSSCCVVQGSTKKANRSVGISIHLSSIKDNKRRRMWIKFVDTLFKLNPIGRFADCSAHVIEDSFEKVSRRNTTGLRRLNRHAYPTIWRPKTMTKSGVKEKSSLPMVIIK